MPLDFLGVSSLAHFLACRGVPFLRYCRSAPRTLRLILPVRTGSWLSPHTLELALKRRLIRSLEEKISKKYIIWNLLAQTFKQNAQYFTFFGPSVIKSPIESGCQGCDCHFSECVQAVKTAISHLTDGQGTRARDGEYAGTAPKVGSDQLKRFFSESLPKEPLAHSCQIAQVAGDRFEEGLDARARRRLQPRLDLNGSGNALR